LNIYNTQLNAYNNSLSDLEALVGNDSGSVKGILKQWKEDLEKTINAINDVLNTPDAQAYHEIRDGLNADKARVINALNNYVIPFISKAEGAKAALESSYSLILSMESIKNFFFSLYTQLRKEADMAAANCRG
jgi:hypothetical protein